MAGDSELSHHIARSSEVGDSRHGCATTSIDRHEFGLTWNQVLETGGVMVGDRIDITIDIEAVRQAAAQVA